MKEIYRGFMDDEAKPFKFEELRKLPGLGYTHNFPQTDFEWPSKAEEIQLNADGSPAKVVAIEWTVNEYNYYVGSMQLILSNGQKSPQFVNNNQRNANNPTRVDLNFPIKKIRGTANNTWLF